MTQAYVALGSNLEQPATQIQAALAALAELTGSRLLVHSSLYRTVPVGYVDQPDFINAVAELDTRLSPHQLLQALMQIEQSFGRVRTFQNAPRVLDLDLLYYHDVTLNDEELTLPHPRLYQRGFVLIPWAEIAADLSLDGYGTIGHLAEAFADSGVERLV
ncbi:2-amino-4-hydroxy-6-hydroxymethyldihydropteridine diphosphokinase [Neisseriaceae bacterium TC5R-5]|nr:2-amino-4-hydroxy-6-hydroxymethyldihydropteridine diphosphokinase [Neisseriaceae bacterium TC5R-5]